MRKLFVLVIMVFIISIGVAHAAEFYVAPNGSASGDGSMSRPWDLQTALNGASGVLRPGDTAWLRGGIYSPSSNEVFRCGCSGTPAQPMKFRQYKNERAVLNASPSSGYGLIFGNAAAQKRCDNVWFWGFELRDPNAIGGNGEYRGPGVSLSSNNGIDYARNVKCINLLVHDFGGHGFSLYGDNLTVYGGIAYFNGRTSYAGSFYGIYAHPNSADGWQEIIDNFFFNNYAGGDMQGWQLHANTAAGYMDNLRVNGNVVFAKNTKNPGVYIGCYDSDYYRPVRNSTISSNYAYGLVNGFNIGGNPALNPGIVNTTISDNYFVKVSSVSLNNPASDLVVRNNRFYNSPFSLQPRYPNNTYYGDSFPQETWVMVRPNQYADQDDPRRANIIVYNWNSSVLSASVPIQDYTVLDGNLLLRYNDYYEVRDVQNYFGTPVVSGQYKGGAIVVPLMLAALSTPVSANPRAPALTHTPSEFNAFVLLRISENNPSPLAPVITSFTATPSTITPGQSSTLSWSSSGGTATELTIDQGIGSVAGQVSKVVTPMQTTTYTLTARNSSGSTQQSVTVTVSTRPPDKFTEYREAEGEQGKSTQLIASMVVNTDVLASGGHYISSNTQDAGSASYTITLPITGTYVLWGRVLSMNSSQDSFYVSVDQGTEDIWDTAESLWSPQWQWTRVTGRNANGGTASPRNENPRHFYLAAGAHTFTFRGRDPNTKLDKLFITNDLSIVPTDSPLRWGDVSGDGNVSGYDAALAAQYVAGLITLAPEQVIRADVSGVGGVSSYDAALIAQYAVGLITKFPVEG